MTIFETLFQKGNGSVYKQPVFKALATVVAVMGVAISIGILFPKAMAVFLSIIWIIFLLVTVIFFVLGILVVVGLRKEASHILDVLMEGSLSIVDFIRFLKLLWERFVALVKEFILYITPLIAYIFALLIYTILLVVYKTYGKEHDVTYFTIGLTSAMVLVIGYLTRPSKKILDLAVWFNKVKVVFKSGFIDAFEVILFLFFLTMDSTNLIFLPANLNIPLHAEIGGYDFMTRAFVPDGHFSFTLKIVVFTIIIEILRNLLRIGATARKHYTNDVLLFSDGILASRTHRVKSAIRRAFHEAKDDLVRFITYTTVLFAVFVLFPRLKLLTLLTASVASLILDLIIVERLFFIKGSDLISRLISRVFRV